MQRPTTTIVVRETILTIVVREKILRPMDGDCPTRDLNYLERSNWAVLFSTVENVMDISAPIEFTQFKNIITFYAFALGQSRHQTIEPLHCTSALRETLGISLQS